MRVDGIQLELRNFVAEKIHSVAQLELLLLLRRDPWKLWTAAEASRALYISAEMTQGLLAAMHAQGLLSIDRHGSYQYGAPAEGLDRQVRQLAELYETRRVSVIAMIYSAPVDKLRSFADAFKFSPDRKRET